MTMLRRDHNGSRESRSPGAGPVIEARGISVGYGPVSVVHDLDLAVEAGEVVALLGVNGAGKTTTVRALAGDLKPSAGEIWFRGQPTTAPLHQRARDGLRFITEERSVFMGLSTADNLRLGGQPREKCLELFPELEPLLSRRAGLLSGGEQQMLTLARALASEPVVLLAGRALARAGAARLRTAPSRHSVRGRPRHRSPARRATRAGRARGGGSGVCAQSRQRRPHRLRFRARGTNRRDRADVSRVVRAERPPTRPHEGVEPAISLKSRRTPTVQ